MQELGAALASHERRQGFVDVGLVRGVGKKALNALAAWRHKNGSGPDQRYEYHQDTMLYSGRDITAAEVVYLDQVDGTTRPEVAEFIGIHEEHLGNIERQLERHTDAVARDIIELVVAVGHSEEWQRELSEKFGVKISSSTSPLVVAGLLMSYAAHEKQKRQNGNRDYFTHPLAVAFLNQMAWIKAAEEARQAGVEVPDEKWLARQLFVDLMHDSVEDAIYKDGKSFVAGQVSLATPLLIRKVLMGLGETKEDAADIVDDIMLVTKTRDLEGETQEPQQYVASCTCKIRAMIAKFCDTAHNKIVDQKSDTSSQKFKKTDAEYSRMQAAIEQGILEDHYDRFGSLTLKWVLRIAKQYAGNHDGLMVAAQNLEFGVIKSAPKLAFA